MHLEKGKDIDADGELTKRKTDFARKKDRGEAAGAVEGASDNLKGARS